MGSGRDSPRPIIWTASMVGSTSSKVETEEEGSEEYLVTKIKSMARILDPLRRPYHTGGRNVRRGLCTVIEPR